MICSRESLSKRAKVYYSPMNLTDSDHTGQIANMSVLPAPGVCPPPDLQVILYCSLSVLTVKFMEEKSCGSTCVPPLL